MRKRLTELREWLVGSGLDAVLVTQVDSIRYLSGFTSPDASLLISADRAILATDFRYREQAKEQAPDFEARIYDPTLATIFAELVRLLGAKKIGFEDADLSYATYQRLSGAMPAGELSLEPVGSTLERLRITKDEIEIGHITQAAQIADAAFAQVVANLKPGMTERQVAWELEKAMRDRGAEGPSFEVIVACGPRGALPHARPTDNVIKEGEPIVIDWGARFEGYCSDCTRTLVLGEADETFAKVYNTVLQAQRAAMKAVHAGAGGAAVDGVARQVITDAGYGEAFGHGLGHGVGLAIHELPVLRKTSTDHLGEGHVFTIEPGIYLPGWGGVRIEDMGTIELGELKLLTKAAKIEEVRGKR